MFITSTMSITENGLQPADRTNIAKRELNPKRWRGVKEYLATVSVNTLSDQDRLYSGYKRNVQVQPRIHIGY